MKRSDGPSFEWLSACITAKSSKAPWCTVSFWRLCANRLYQIRLRWLFMQQVWSSRERVWLMSEKSAIAPG